MGFPTKRRRDSHTSSFAASRATVGMDRHWFQGDKSKRPLLIYDRYKGQNGFTAGLVTRSPSFWIVRFEEVAFQRPIMGRHTSRWQWEQRCKNCRENAAICHMT
jgi:hypothetical protein